MFIWRGKFVSYDGHRWVVNEIFSDRVSLVRFVDGMPFEREVSLAQLDRGGSWLKKGLVG
ncbi:hypothetical protein [Brevibacillus sp. SYSU BS000544]|uniref:hypothetical protein n=1 Tax=Brevibacillus sp. SYSU BS000544 TaxID=3416443 RepID=UPI003CE5419D